MQLQKGYKHKVYHSHIYVKFLIFDQKYFYQLLTHGHCTLNDISFRY